MIEPHFHRLFSLKTGSKTFAGSLTKVWHLIYQCLLSICCHIESGMSYLRIFVEDIGALLGATTDIWV